MKDKRNTIASIGPKHVYAMAAIVLFLALALAAMLFVPESTRPRRLDIAHAAYTETSFTLEERASDINPGRDYVLYTNYACPYCAAFHKANVSCEYTTRILLRDNDSERFNTQATVCSYMLFLYRTNAQTFREVEDWLFDNQPTWTTYGNKEILAVLNEKSGMNWDDADLAPTLVELEADKEDIPEDLEFVPAFFATGRCYNSYLLDTLGA